MSATRMINGQQFMSVRHLMKMPGVDAGQQLPTGRDGHHTVADGNRTGRVSTMAPHKAREYTQGSALEHTYPELRDKIRSGDVDPVHVDKGKNIWNDYNVREPLHPRDAERPMLGNGHHRVALAHQMGVRWLPISANHADSRRNE